MVSDWVNSHFQFKPASLFPQLKALTWSPEAVFMIEIFLKLFFFQDPEIQTRYLFKNF